MAQLVARLLRTRKVPGLSARMFHVVILALCCVQLEQVRANEINHDIHLANTLFLDKCLAEK